MRPSPILVNHPRPTSIALQGACVYCMGYSFKPIHQYIGSVNQSLRRGIQVHRVDNWYECIDGGHTRLNTLTNTAPKADRFS